MEARLNYLFSIIILIMAMGLAGCEDDKENYLEGSLTKTFDFSFDTVRARLYESELSIEYIDEKENAEQVALRVTLRRDGTPLKDGETYNLLDRGTVGRGAGYSSALPELESGTLKLSEFGAESQSTVSGEFEAVFITEENTKQTLRGGFLAKLEVVDI